MLLLKDVAMNEAAATRGQPSRLPIERIARAS